MFTPLIFYLFLYLCHYVIRKLSDVFPGLGDNKNYIVVSISFGWINLSRPTPARELLTLSFDLFLPLVTRKSIPHPSSSAERSK